MSPSLDILFLLIEIKKDLQRKEREKRGKERKKGSNRIDMRYQRVVRK